MKALFLLFIVVGNVLCNVESYQDSEISLLMSGKWYLESIEMAGQKIDLPTEMRDESWVIFHKNGKHEFMEMGQKSEGIWTYQNKKKTIITEDRDGKLPQKIINISPHKLKLEIIEDSQTMYLHFKQ